MRLLRLAAAMLLVLGAGCADSSALTPFSSNELAVLTTMSPLGPLPPSTGNMYADDPRAAALGHRLFFDQNLSVTGRTSCATCHDPAQYFTDGRKRAMGRGEGSRNTPSILLAPHYPFQSWDGRKDSIWSQALSAFVDDREHGLSVRDVAMKVIGHHGEAYRAAFGPSPDLADPVAAENVFAAAGKSVEAYVRSVARLEPSPFDQYVAAITSGDSTGGGHLSDSAIRGLRAFIGDAHCIDCHHGPLFSDREFHVIGLPPVFGAPDLDEGRAAGIARLERDPYSCGGAFSDTHDCPNLRFINRTSATNIGAIRTPSLRNVEKTAPYMHGGQLATLEDVIDNYRSLMHEPRLGQPDPLLRRVGGDVRTNDLVAFLRSLTSPEPQGLLP